MLNLSGTNTYAPLSTGTVNTNTTPITTGGGSVVINANSAVNVTHSQTLSNLTIADGVEVNFGDGTPFSDGTVRSAAALRSALPKR